MNDADQSVNSLSLSFEEALYANYLRDPDSVSPDWRQYFDELSRGDKAKSGGNRSEGNGSKSNGANGNGHKLQLGPQFRPSSFFARPPQATAQTITPAAPGSPRRNQPNGCTIAQVPAAAVDSFAPVPSAPTDDLAVLQDRVDQLIRAYRVRGHMVANVDPLGRPRPQLPELDPRTYHFTETDMDRTFSTDTIEGPQVMTLQRIVERMSNTYCRSIGVQFMHMDDMAVRHWLQVRMEGSENRLTLSRREQFRILMHLTNAAVFEEFIQKRFLGAKSFSLEGAETLIPLLEMVIERAGEHRCDEVVFAMAHRGRLNVLANIMGKSPQQIFREFADLDAELHIGRGDVKYHLGHSTDWVTSGGKKVHLSLCFNPSHLEFVDPVAVGRVRAKQDRVDDLKRRRGLCVLIHGDAAFAGEGIIQETLNLSQLQAYQIGGTFHVVVNNQIGFTTSPSEARSSGYATDVAKVLQARSSTSTAKIPRRSRKWFAWEWISAESFSATW